MIGISLGIIQDIASDAGPFTINELVWGNQTMLWNQIVLIWGDP